MTATTLPTPHTPIVRDGRTLRIPASDAQRRLWFVDRLEHTGTEYNLPDAVRIRGDLDVRSLERALYTIVERHEALRTRFDHADGDVVQIVEPSMPWRLAHDDLRALDEEAKAARIRDAIEREWSEPFDLARGPLFRMRLLTLHAREHVFIRTAHHIVFDGWSIGVFNHELWTLYEAYVEGRANPLAPLPLQYAEFTLWQRERTTEQKIAAGLTYWKARLAGAPARLDLPTDRVRPAVQTFDAEIHRTAIEGERLAGLRRLSRENHATLYMTLLSAFGVLMARHSGATDLVIGTPIACRPAQTLGDLIGFFANTAVMRMCLEPAISFRQLLASVRRHAIEAHDYQHISFDRLVRELSPQRSVSSSPLVQVVFALQNAPWMPPRLKDLDVEPIEHDRIKLRSDLSVHAYERGARLEVPWYFNTGLFDRWRIEQLARQYIRVLGQVADNPDRPLGAIAMLDDDEHRRIVISWNETARAFERDVRVDDLVERHAATIPDAPAVISGDQTLTYEQLNSRANQVANLLQQAGVGPEALVGVCVDRSADAAIALLGVLKAGGAYVPLDPRYPRERLQYMLADSAVGTIVTTARVQAALPSVPARLVRLDADRRAIDCCSLAAPPSSARPDNLAYVIYTSGSTGVPKGVQIEHGGLAHYVQALSASLPGVFGRRCLHTASFGFSSSVRQLFAPLCAGGTVVVADDDTVRSASALLELAVDAEIDTIDLVPSVWRSVVACLRSEDATLRSRLANSRLQTVLFASEPLGAQSLVGWRSLMGTKAAFFNMYGQTETTGIVTIHPIDERDLAAQGNIDIGRPIPNTKAYVLDADFQPMPPGVPGDLYIAGPGIARGYLNQRELTAARFVDNPFDVRGTRLYRTGDRARYTCDGVIALLGRTDDQIKIHGCRVNCGEVEAALRGFPEVRDAAVVADRTHGGDVRLIAHVVSAVHEFDPSRLHAALKSILPDYMVPPVIVAVDALPQTPHGKLDRQRLPPVPASETGIERRPPRTPEERVICEEFAAVLGVDTVGIDDNFFALGGYSLVATSLVNRIRARLDATLPLNAVFDAPTVADLARHVRERPRTGGPSAPLTPRWSLAPNGAPASKDAARPWKWPSTILEDQVADLWERILRIRRIGVYDDFFELGGTPELCELMLTGIEHLTGHRLRLSDVPGGATVHGIATALIADLPACPVLEVQRGDSSAKRPFFFLHGDLGGGGLYVRELARGLGENQPVYVLQQHGMNGRPVPPSIEAMADDHVRVLQEFWPHGPYALGGHCNGAAIAFEMARRLVAQHREVAALLLVEPPIGQRQGLSMDPPRTLPMLPPEHMRRPQIRVAWLFSQYRAVMQHYRAEPYVGEVDLFWAKYREEEQDPRPLLEPLARALTLHIVPGTHVTALGRHVRKLAAEMARCLQ